MWPPPETSEVGGILFLFGTYFCYFIYTRWRRNRTAPQSASMPPSPSKPASQSTSSTQLYEATEAQSMREHYLRYRRLREQHLAHYRRPDAAFDLTEAETSQAYIDEFTTRIKSQPVSSIAGIGKNLSCSSNWEQAAAKTPLQQSLQSAPQTASKKLECPQPAGIKPVPVSPSPSPLYPANNRTQPPATRMNRRAVLLTAGTGKKSGSSKAEQQAAKQPAQQLSPPSPAAPSCKPESPHPASNQPMPAPPSSLATNRSQPAATQAQQTIHHGGSNEPHSNAARTTSPTLSWIEKFEQTLVRLRDSPRSIDGTGETEGSDSMSRVKFPSTIEELHESYDSHFRWVVQSRQHDRLKYCQWRRDTMMACFPEAANEINVTRRG